MFPIKRHSFEYEECSVEMTCERLDDTSQWHKEVQLFLGGLRWTWARPNLMLIPEIFLCEEGIFFSFFFLSVTWRKDNIARLPLKGVKDGWATLFRTIFNKKKLFYLSFRIIGSRSKLQGGSTIKTRVARVLYLHAWNKIETSFLLS